MEGITWTKGHSEPLLETGPGNPLLLQQLLKQIIHVPFHVSHEVTPTGVRPAVPTHLHLSFQAP